MRLGSRSWLMVPVLVSLVHCAQGTTLGELAGAGGYGGEGSSVTTGTRSTSSTGTDDTTMSSTESSTSGSSFDTSSSTTSAGGAGGTGGASTSSSSSSSSTSSTTSSTSSTTSSTSATTSASTTTSSATTSTSSGGTTNCDPTSPGAVCGSAAHCLPETDGNPVCMGPVGSGTAYTSCSTPGDCKAALQCVDTGDIFGLPCCLKWCTASTNCGSGSTCTYLDPAVYVGSVEYGVCFDGLGGC